MEKVKNFYEKISDVVKNFFIKIDKSIKKFMKEVKKDAKLRKYLVITFVSIVLITILIIFLTLSPRIHLTGSQDIYINLNSEFKEPGYSAKYFGKNLTSKVKVTSNVDTTKIGEYEVEYYVKSLISLRSTKIRRFVTVVDKTEPVITLEGNTEVTIYVKNEYKEPGFTASDNYDGDITDKVVVQNNVDNSKIGSYEIVYKVSDSSGNETSVKRVVKVINRPVSSSFYTSVTVPTVTGTKGSLQMVSLAEEQLGNVGGEIYWRWYGFNYKVPWCAAFISWLANELGYLDTLIPKTASVPTMVRWFRSNGQLQKSSYEPKPGEIIFFDWNVDGHPDHVGLVEKVENGRIYTIEGNSRDECKRRDYSITSNYVYGYGTPLY